MRRVDFLGFLGFLDDIYAAFFVQLFGDGFNRYDLGGGSRYGERDTRDITLSVLETF